VAFGEVGADDDDTGRAEETGGPLGKTGMTTAFGDVRTVAVGVRERFGVS
jgi:hypothetical protein